MDKDVIRVAEANLANAHIAYSNTTNTVSDADIQQAQLHYDQAQHNLEEKQSQQTGWVKGDYLTLGPDCADLPIRAE